MCEKHGELPEVSRALFDLDCDPLAARLIAEGLRKVTVMLTMSSPVSLISSLAIASPERYWCLPLQVHSFL